MRDDNNKKNLVNAKKMYPTKQYRQYVKQQKGNIVFYSAECATDIDVRYLQVQIR